MFYRIVCLLVSCAALTARALPPLAPITEAAVAFTPRISQVESRVTLWQTDWGSYDKLVGSSRMLELRVKVVGEVQPEFGVLWYFYARDAGDQNRIFLMGSGRGQATLGPGGEAVLRMMSPDFSGSVGKVSGERRRVDGSWPEGWGVALVQGAKVVAVTGSRAELMARTRAEADATLGQIAESRAGTSMAKKKTK